LVIHIEAVEVTILHYFLLGEVTDFRSHRYDVSPVVARPKSVTG
jgi:hypothetical protein